MKVMIFITRILWAIAIPLLVITTIVNIYISSLPLYKYSFEKYNISSVTGISDKQLDDAAYMMSVYLSGQVDTPQITVDKNGKSSPLYNEKELVHLADVRVITDIFRFIQVASFIGLLITGAVLFYRRDFIQMLIGIRYGAAVALVFTGVLIIWGTLDFDSLFYLFHILSFNNDLWLLDPAHDYLIMMFPQAFFNDAAMLIVNTIITVLLLLLVAAIIMNKLMLKKAGIKSQ